MEARHEVAAAAETIAAAIGRRDLPLLRAMLAPGFVHLTHGGGRVGAERFLAGIEQIPGEILAVKLEQLEIAIFATGALVLGFQHARVRLDGQLIDDRRGFIDWFVEDAGTWRIQAAVDLPGSNPD